MKKIVLRMEKDKNSLRDFKKEKIKYQKIFLSKLWNFSKKKNIDLALDFSDLKDFEKPDFQDLNLVKYFILNSGNTKDIIIFTKKNKKIIYSLGENGFENDLKNIFKKDKNILEKDFNKFLKNIFIDIHVDDSSEEFLFKKIVYLKKILLKILNKKDLEKVNILLRNNFSWEINQDILENKLLNIDGVILE